jgi:hypothetical protein
LGDLKNDKKKEKRKKKKEKKEKEKRVPTSNKEITFPLTELDKSGMEVTWSPMNWPGGDWVPKHDNLRIRYRCVINQPFLVAVDASTMTGVSTRRRSHENIHQTD